MSSDPIGFVIKRPEPGDKGDYIIFITRPSAGPFGTAGTAIFACDAVETDGKLIVVKTQHGLVTFPNDLPFLCVPRVNTYPVTTKEAAEMQLAEKKEWEAVYEADEAASGPVSEAVVRLDDGRLKHDSQGYL